MKKLIKLVRGNFVLFCNKLKTDCDFKDFYEVASKIEANGYSFHRKIDGFDSIYWKFKLLNSNVTLHYNIYIGLEIYIMGIRRLSKEKIKTLEALIEKVNSVDS